MVSGDYATQSNDLLGAGITPGWVDQTGGQSECPRLQGFVEECFHPLEFCGGGSTLIQTLDCDARGSMPYQGCNIDPQSAALHGLQISIKSPPLPTDFRLVRDGTPLSAYLGQVSIVHRCGRHPAIADHMGCGTLPDSTLRPPVDQDGKVRMGMDIDETRGDETSSGVYPPLSLRSS